MSQPPKSCCTLPFNTSCSIRSHQRNDRLLSRWTTFCIKASRTINWPALVSSSINKSLSPPQAIHSQKRLRSRARSVFARKILSRLVVWQIAINVSIKRYGRFVHLLTARDLIAVGSQHDKFTTISINVIVDPRSSAINKVDLP